MAATETPAPEEVERLTQLQMSLKSRVDTSQAVTGVRYVAGCDLTAAGSLQIGGFVVVDLENNLEPVYQKCSHVSVDFPYIPGLLAFREGPVVLECLRQCREERPDIQIDVLLVDGSGQWHERGFGLGCYVGVECGIPTIGVHKNFLAVGSEDTRDSVNTAAQTSCPEVGDTMLLHHVLPDGTPIDLAVMRTTDASPFRPIYISPGHLIDLNSSIEIVRTLCRYKEPEPLRLADRLSRQVVRDLKKQSQSK